MTLKNITLSLLMLFPISANALPYVYVANNMNNAVNVIDAATNTPLTTIPLPPPVGNEVSNPTAIAIAPNGKTVCVANGKENTSGIGYFAVFVSVIDATLPIPALINNITVSNSFLQGQVPSCVAYTTDSSSIYITCDDGNVYKVTDITGSQTVTLATSAIPTTSCIAIGNTPNGETAYVGTYQNNSTFGIYYMDIATNTPQGIANTGNIYSSIEAIAIAPDGLTVYAVATNSQSYGRDLYAIDTTTNTVIGYPIDLGAMSQPSGIVVSPDGSYLYITDNNTPGDIIVIPTNDLLNITTFSSTDAFALAITSDSKELYVINTSATVSPYLVPAGSSAGAPIVLGGGALRYSIVIGSSSLAAPASVSGCKTQNVFLLQTDYINNITWTAPTTGTPAAYAIYRDPALTQLVSIVPASSPLQYYDHGRNPSVTYSYYIVSVDASGNQSAATSVTVTKHC